MYMKFYYITLFLLQGRFFVGGPLTVALPTAVDVITSTAVLHNICEEQGVPVEVLQEGDDIDDRVDNVVQDQSGQQIRAMIIRDRF